MIGLRLKEERERLGFTQEAFAEIAGAKRRTLIDWEKGVSSPTAAQMAALATVDADVQFIITGQRQGHGIGESAIHQAVLDAIDLLSLDKKVDAGQLAKAVVKLVAKSGNSQALMKGAGRMSVTFGGENKGAVADTIIGAGVVNLGKKP